MKTALKVTGAFLLTIAVFVGIGFAAQGTDFFIYKAFAPKYEQVRYDTFKQSQAFNDGVSQQIDRARVEFSRTKDPDARAAIASTILHEFAGYDRLKLTPDQALFLEHLDKIQLGGSQ